MPNYITVADVDALLGSGWAGTGDAAQAVTMANAWLNSKITRQVPDPVPDEIKLAGAQVAKEAAAGKLFGATQREVTSSKVSAQSGTFTEKTYAAGSVALTAGENYAMVLIRPWAKRQGVSMLKRV